jgi:uncharacterized protein YijF (DUF1287 family)
MPSDVNTEIRRVKHRLDAIEATERLLFKVQTRQLAQAEQLRRLAKDATAQNATTRQVDAAFKRLRWFVEDLPAFHQHPRAPRARKASSPAKPGKRK